MYKKFKSVLTLILGIAAIGLFQSVNADWTVNTGGGVSAGQAQDIVISLQSNPKKDPERACLAVTFARSLSGKANVTLFVTLDGVSLADKKVIKKRRFTCETPWEEEISIKESLEIFISGNNNNMVVCPLCWNSRYDNKLPDYGVLPIGPIPDEDPDDHIAPNNAIGKMILDADKILDF